MDNDNNKKNFMKDNYKILFIEGVDINCLGNLVYDFWTVPKALALYNISAPTTYIFLSFFIESDIDSSIASEYLIFLINMRI